MKKELKIAAAIATIVGAAAAVYAVFIHKPMQVQAANGSVAVGGNLDVKGDLRVNQHDFDAQTRAEAQTYLSVAHGSCKAFGQRIQAYTAETSVNPQEIAQLMPQELYPVEQVAEAFDEQTYSSIYSKVSKIEKESGAVRAVLIRNSVAAMSPQNERTAKRLAEEREGFVQDQMMLLVSIEDLCGYLGRLRQGGA